MMKRGITLYYCPRCGKRWEEVASKGRPEKKTCPECGNEFEESELKREAGKLHEAARKEKRARVAKGIKKKRAKVAKKLGKLRK